MVHVKESPDPIPIEDLKTGQHIRCFDTTEDARVPTTPKYCQVLGW